nr:hypothetical protein [Tanacetum cinerariifolium]
DVANMQWSTARFIRARAKALGNIWRFTTTTAPTGEKADPLAKDDTCKATLKIMKPEKPKHDEDKTTDTDWTTHFRGFAKRYSNSAGNLKRCCREEDGRNRY